MKDKVTVGSRLRQIMSERNLKQVDILNKTIPLQSQYNVRIAKNDLSQYVNDKVEPNQERIFILAQALNVTEPWLMGFNVPREKLEDLETYQPNPIPTIDLPYLGTVSAGGFEYAAEYNDTMAIPSHLVNDDYHDYFILKTNGDSMNREIANGHYVIVQDIRDGSYQVKNGDILIFKSGGEHTMKRVKKTDTMIYLEPDSYLDGFSTQSFVIGEKHDLEIIGKVVYSFKEF